MEISIKTHEARVALVTDAGQGIGRTIALVAAERGALVIATGLKPPHGTIRKMGPTATALQLDVTQEGDWRSACVKSRAVGKVDMVVNNVSNMDGLAIPGMSHYIPFQVGIIGFMRRVAYDGIIANAVLPGLTNTLARALQSQDQKRATWEQQAIKRLGEPEGVTGAVLFLTSNDAAFNAAPGEIYFWDDCLMS